MAKQAFQMHLYADEDYDFKTGETVTQFRLIPWANTESFGAYIGPVEVHADVPDTFDFRAAKLEKKQRELAKVRAEFTARITELQRQINELQAIEYVQPEA